MALLKLNLSVTFRCNFRCKYCNIWKKPTIKELTTNDFKLIFERNKPLWISITGGEPFLRKDIDKIISLATIYGTKIMSINTNGYLTDIIVKKLSKSEIPRKHLIVISLHGRKETHESLTGVRGSYDKAINTFFKLRELGFNTKFEFLVTRENYKDLYYLVEKGAFDVRDFIITFPNVSAYYGHRVEEGRQTLFLSQREFVEFLREYMRKFYSGSLFDLLYKEYLRGLYNFYLKRRRRYPCVSGIRSFWIMPSGDVYNCIFMKYYLGNIRNYNYRLPIRREYWKSIRRCNLCWTPCEAFSSILLSPFSLFKI